MVTGGLVFLLVMFLSYTQIYMLFGAVIIGVGLWAFSRNPASEDMVPQHKK